jgi:GxxExxY protein
MDALELEFAAAGLLVQRNAPLTVWYGEEDAGRVRLPHQYRADFLVNGKVLVMVKAEGDTGDVSDYALISLLRAAGLHLVILVQFKDKKVQTNRVCVYDRHSNSMNFRKEDWYRVEESEGRERREVEAVRAE